MSGFWVVVLCIVAAGAWGIVIREAVREVRALLRDEG